MLTSIRKVQKETLILVTFVVCVAFAFLYSKYDAGLGDQTGPGEAVTVWGKSHRGAEALKLANQFSLALTELGFQLPNANQGGIAMAALQFIPPYMVRPIGGFARDLNFIGRTDLNEDRTNYVVNLLVLRGAAERLGVAAGPDMVHKTMEQIEIFRDPSSGRFSQALVERFVDERMGRHSMGESELKELIGNFVDYRKIGDLVSSGMEPTSWELDREYRHRYEELTVYEVLLKRDDASKTSTVTDEEVKKYYEDNRETLRSPEKRKIGYFIFPLPARMQGELEARWKAKRIEEARAFTKVYRAVGEAIQSGGSLEDALKLVENQKSREAGPFAQPTPPEELKGETDLLRRVFEASQSEHGLGYAETQKAMYLFWLKEVLPPAPLSLAEAKGEIQARLQAQKKDQMMNERAQKSRDSLAAELKKGGRTFPDVAKAAGVTATRLKPFNRMTMPENSAAASTVASLVSEMRPGQLSQPTAIADGTLLVFLAQAQLPKRNSEPEDRKRIAEALHMHLGSQAFMAWFEDQKKKANPILPTVKLRNGEVQTLSIERFNRQ